MTQMMMNVDILVMLSQQPFVRNFPAGLFNQQLQCNVLITVFWVKLPTSTAGLLGVGVKRREREHTEWMICRFEKIMTLSLPSL